MMNAKKKLGIEMTEEIRKMAIDKLCTEYNLDKKLQVLRNLKNANNLKQFYQDSCNGCFGCVLASAI